MPQTPPPAVQDPEARAEELARNLNRVRARIDEAVRASGREDTPGLIVVTKFHPARDAATLVGLGVTDVGENREQEAGPKAEEVAALGGHPTWHFIGQLQSNKAARVLRFSREVHSVDRPGLIDALERAAQRVEDRADAPVRVGCYLQLDLRDERAGGGEANAPRGGADPADMLRLAHQVAESAHLCLRGLMAVAPLGVDPNGPFERLAALSQRLRRDHPGATEISAGMSHDLEQAVANGATRLRIGTEVLGPRPAVR